MSRRLPERPSQRQLRISWMSMKGLLWVLVIVLLVVLYTVPFSERYRQASARSGLDPLAFLPMVLFGFFLFFLSRIRRFNRRNKAGMEHLVAGRLREAGEAFEANAKWMGTPLIKAGAVHNLGIVKLKLGELGEAASLFGEIERVWFSGASVLCHLSACHLSLCMALEGDIEAAGDWLGVASRRSATPSVYPMLAEAALLCRQGKLAEMDALAKAKGAEAERGMTGEYARLFRVFHAFALDGLGDAGLPSALAKAAPSVDGEYAYLGVRWPEMAAFLERNRLSKAA